MACPHVAGLTALILAQHPTWSNEQVRQAIQMQSDDILTTGFDRYSGFGRINAYRSVTSPEPMTAFISTPTDAATISDVVNVVGTASGPGFTGYTLDCGVGAEPTTWAFIADGTTPVTKGVLAAWNPDGLAGGIYTLRLRTTGTGSLDAEYRTQVTVVSPCGSYHYTQLFSSSSMFDLSNTSLTFVPDGSDHYYSMYRQPIISLPTDPTGGTPLSLTDNSFAPVTLGGDAKVSIYSSSSSTFYVGSNGYITLGSGDISSVPSYGQHFTFSRVSALFDNLVPPAESVTWKQLADHAAITFQNVPEYGTSNSNTFQIEMFFNGKIVISYLNIAAVNCLAGLSSGSTTPAIFSPTDLSACGTLVAVSRMLAIVSPNGREEYEPGHVVPITWSSMGSKWTSDDTVWLEYSLDGGANWNTIDGASTLAYNADLFNWNTTGLAESNDYRVRVVYNGDDSVSDSSNSGFIIAPDYSFNIKREIKVLSFVQYSGNSVEYRNTLTAIRTQYAVSNTELTSYATLATAIVDKQVLLIPEQALTNLSKMQEIGAFWRSTLDSFLASGGRVVVCDYMEGTYGILTGAGLMSISAQTSVTGQLLQVSDSSSPIASGVSAYTAGNGSCCYTTTETGAIITTGSGAPVVLAKPITAGYIVLIGHDYFISNANQDKLIANAAGAPLEELASSIADLKTIGGSNQLVRLLNPAVVTYAPRNAASARSTNFFYIGDTKALGCIRVIDANSDDLHVGDAVSGLVGRASRSDLTGEWRLQLMEDPTALTLDSSVGISALSPIGLNGRAALGDAIVLTNPVKVWGKAAGLADNGASFMVNDGSADLIVLLNGTPLPDGFATGKMVVVSGILTKDDSARRIIYAQEVRLAQ